jgi:hypothetical protein
MIWLKCVAKRLYYIPATVGICGPGLNRGGVLL